LIENKKLNGKNISFFLDGGWEITGVVLEQVENKIIIKKDDNMYLLFKEKVSFLRINEAANAKLDSINKNEDLEDLEDFPENGISYTETFANIPASLLGSSDDKDDLSISFKEIKNSPINFRIQNDS
jgi:sRNA-binding regulator protein Hfq